ncbi:hypothetical protein BVI434_400036 [Burkholderia vietnamiensis]|nr:hypothetical protein BVI1335_2580007 [Burkholderia vietnamiensis]CAG9221929.1 hypothetical protein BVI434_400036 [Burkholderia vietnamiensis]
MADQFNGSVAEASEVHNRNVERFIFCCHNQCVAVRQFAHNLILTGPLKNVPNPVTRNRMAFCEKYFLHTQAS